MLRRAEVQAQPEPLSALAQAFADLDPGESSTTVNGQNGAQGLTADALGSIQWVNRGHYDHERGKIIVIGKWHSQVNGGQRATMVYDEPTDVWDSSILHHATADELGHIYESSAYDRVTGTIYSGCYNQTYFHKLVPASDIDAWTQTEAYGQHWNPNSTPVQPSAACHPHLFGSNDGGLVILRNVTQDVDMELLAFRFGTGTYHSIPGTQHECVTGPQLGAVEYCRAGNYVIGSSATGNTYRIPAGSGGSLGTAVQIENPPIPCRQIGGGATGGILIDDPTGTGHPYVFQKGNGSSSLYWQYNGSTYDEIGSHPFPDNALTTNTDWCLISCYPYGGFYCRRDVSSARLIFKPS